MSGDPTRSSSMSLSDGETCFLLIICRTSVIGQDWEIDIYSDHLGAEIGHIARRAERNYRGEVERGAVWPRQLQ